MRRHGMPLAPLMIGMVPGPLAETSLCDELLFTVGSKLKNRVRQDD